MNRRKFIGSLGLVAAVGGIFGSKAPEAVAATAPRAKAPGSFALRVLPSGKDDTAALQAAINQCIRTKSRLELGPGVFHVSDTLKIDTCVDFKMRGMGPIDQGAKDGWALRGRATGTCLRWKGPAGGTMIQLKSAWRPTLSGLFLEAANSAGVCVQMTTVLGWPTSQTRLRDVTVSQATTAGIQFGVPDQPNMDNTDLSDFSTVRLNRCAIGIRVCNNQSVGHYWRRIWNSWCPVGIEFLQGGDAVLERGFQDGSGPANTTFWATHGGGENAAQIQITGVHIEYGRLFDSRKSFGVVVVGLRGIQDSRSDDHAPPLCEFGRLTTATILTSQLKGPVVAKPESSITVIGCTYVTNSVARPVGELVQGTKQVHVL
jgi:hypothetical protein